MAKKTVADAAKAKQAKQKKMVILLAVVFVLAIGYAVNTMMGMQSGGGQKPVAASATAPTSTTSSPTSTTPTAAPTLAGSTPTASTSTPSSTSGSTGSTDSSQLVAVVTPPMDPGQLQSFGNFASKDPFNTNTSTTPNPNPPNPNPPNPNPPNPNPVPVPPNPPATSAVISVNGTDESVAAGSNFPSTNPIFQLVSVTTAQAKVAIAGGSYSTGQPTLTLSVNKPVTLVNTADGTRYTLTLMPQGTAVAPSSGGASSPSASAPSPSAPTTTTGP